MKNQLIIDWNHLFTEKTQIVRSSQNGDSGVRPVQMYGALSAIDATGRPSSGLDAVRDENHAAGSDDDHSVRTMIVSVLNQFV